jgi:hypothetical protein
MPHPKFSGLGARYKADSSQCDSCLIVIGAHNAQSTALVMLCNFDQVARVKAHNDTALND